MSKLGTIIILTVGYKGLPSIDAGSHYLPIESKHHLCTKKTNSYYTEKSTKWTCMYVRFKTFKK